MHESILTKVRAELQEYLTFQPGWDGYTGKTFSPPFITFVISLVEHLLLQFGDELTDLIPGPASDGSIDLEFRTKDAVLFVTLYEGESPVYVIVPVSSIDHLR